MKIVTIISVIKFLWGVVAKLFFGKDDTKAEKKKLRKDIRITRYDIMQEIKALKSISAKRRNYNNLNRLIAKRNGLQEQLDEILAP